VTKAAIILALRALLVVQPQAHALLRAVAMPTRPPGAVFPIERHFENDRRLAAHARTRRGDGEGDRVVIGTRSTPAMKPRIAWVSCARRNAADWDAERLQRRRSKAGDLRRKLNLLPPRAHNLPNT